MSTRNPSRRRAAAPQTAVTERLEALRQRLLCEAMPFVETTRRALDEVEQLNEREVLCRVFHVLDEVALKLSNFTTTPSVGGAA